MKVYKADLHVHTLLSPCAEIEMTPHNIIINAVANNVDIVAITDHNSNDNIPAAIQAAAGSGVTVIPGMEVETSEEIHIVALFGKMKQLLDFSSFIDLHRSLKKNSPEKFGPQYVVSADDEFLREKTEMLLCPVAVTVAEAVKKIHLFGGIAIAAHIERPANGILSILGFIPDELELDAVEVSGRIKLHEARKRFKTISKPFIASSDAHFMDALINGPKTALLLESPSFAEIVMAIRSESGRKIIDDL